MNFHCPNFHYPELQYNPGLHNDVHGILDTELHHFMDTLHSPIHPSTPDVTDAPRAVI
jgi:hypothetical protein